MRQTSPPSTTCTSGNQTSSSTRPSDTCRESEMPGSRSRELLINLVTDQLSPRPNCKNAYLTQKVSPPSRKIQKSKRSSSIGCIRSLRKRKRADLICMSRASRMSWGSARLCPIRRRSLAALRDPKASRFSMQMTSQIWSRLKSRDSAETQTSGRLPTRTEGKGAP